MGLTDKPEGPYTTRLLADDTKVLVDALGIDDFHMVGVSMGGMVAQEYALAHGGDLRSLVLACTYATPGPFCSRMFSMWADLAPEMGVPFVMRDVALWAFTVPFFEDREEELEGFEAELASLTMPTEAYLAQLAAIRAHDAAGRLGGTDVLVNNTGGLPPGNFENLDDGAWQQAFEQIIMSLVRCVRGVISSVRERGGGRIVKVASSSVKQPIEGLTLSNAFRAGINGLAKSLSVELVPHNILVNTLGPGRMLTGRTESVDAGQAESRGVSVEGVREGFAARIPLCRYGTPEEFARVAAFLCFPANSYLTGQAVLMDGGMVKAL